MAVVSFWFDEEARSTFHKRSKLRTQFNFISTRWHKSDGTIYGAVIIGGTYFTVGHFAVGLFPDRSFCSQTKSGVTFGGGDIPR